MSLVIKLSATTSLPVCGTFFWINYSSWLSNITSSRNSEPSLTKVKIEFRSLTFFSLFSSFGCWVVLNLN